jgi:hypothetical protein
MRVEESGPYGLLNKIAAVRGGANEVSMLNFIANAFRGLYEFLLWINLIAFTIGGSIVGKVVFGGYRSDGHPILGGIIGFLIGMILNILGAGLVTIFLRIDENLKILVKLNEGKPNVNPTAYPILKEKKKCKQSGKSVDSGYTGCPHCGASDFE